MTRSKTDREHDVATTISVALFYWPPYVAMSLAARSLWLGLYISGAARRCPIGLFNGGPASMAEAARMSLADAEAALAELVGKGLVEFDEVAMVARLTELPDRCERPDNGNVLLSWWRRWKTVPRCAVRDRHVRLLRWLMEPMTEDHARAWAKTFAEVEAALAAAESGDGSGNGIRNGSRNRSPNGSDSAGSADMGNRSPNGPGEGEGEGEGEDLLSSRQIAPLQVGRDPDPARVEAVGVTAAELWAAVLGRLSERVLAQQLDLWVTPIQPLAFDGSTLQLRAPNAYVRSWFEAHYLADVTAELGALVGVDLRVTLEVDPVQRRSKVPEREPADVENLAPRALERYGPRAAGRGGR